MKEFIDRLGLVIHWLGFLLGISIPIGFLFGAIFVNDPDNLSVLPYTPIMFLLFSLSAWLFRFILSGKNHFLPWKKI